MTAGTRTGGRDATTAVVPGAGVLSIGNPHSATPPGYEWTLLEAVARLESGHTPSRARADYWNGGIPWIGIRDATGHNGEVIKSTIQNVSQLGVDNSSTRLLPEGTVCLSRTASVGYVVQMGVPMCTSQDFVNWVCSDRLRNDYLRYALMVEAESVRRWAYGSTHQTLYYPEAKALHLLMPARAVQDSVADVLGALDDKIAANRRIVDVARTLMDTLVTRAAGHVQEEATVGDASVLLSRGKAPRYTEDGELVIGQRCVRQGRVLLENARRSEWVKNAWPVEHGDVLVNSTGMGSLGRVGRWTLPERAFVDTHVTVVRFDSSKVNPSFAGVLLSQLEAQVESLAEGSTGQTELRRDLLAGLRLGLPDRATQDAVGVQIDQFTQRRDAAVRENERLAATRDELLPLLMNGTITVKDAESTVGEVI